MPVQDVTQDVARRTMTVVATFPAPPGRVWSLYADPRLIERHWGPPGWPATFVRHELAPGARSHYFMSGPDGARADGVWNVVAVDEPRSFEVDDAFADEHGEPDESMGWTRMRVDLAPADDGTRVVVTSVFRSAEQLQQMIDMGMEEGLRLAMGQIDALLEDPAT